MLKNFLYLLLVLFSLMACDNKQEKRPTISEKQLVDILVDVHLTDASLSSKNIYTRRGNYLPSYYYNSIYEKYGISPTQFDSCINYYGRHSQRFNQLYDQVIDSLNRLETKLKIEMQKTTERLDTVNLWNQKDTLILPDSVFSHLPFNIPTPQKGVYTLKAEIKLFLDDETDSPQFRIYFWKADTTSQGARRFFKPIQLIRDGKFHKYEAQMELPDSTYTHLKGEMLFGTNKDKDYNQHAEVRNIFIYNPRVHINSQIPILKDIRPKGKK